MKIWPEMDQGTEEWFKARAGKPTASEFSRIITPTTGKDAGNWDDLATELCAECLRPDEVEWPGNKHTERGHALEPLAREEFQRIMGLKVQEVGFVSAKHAGCSPDGLVYDGDKLVAGLEIKSPLAIHHAKALIAKEMPAKHKPQVHGGMVICELKFWYFMSFCPKVKPLIVRIEWDDYTDKVANALDRFLTFYRQVRTTIMPALRP